MCHVERIVNERLSRKMLEAEGGMGMLRKRWRDEVERYMREWGVSWRDGSQMPEDRCDRGDFVSARRVINVFVGR